MFSMLKYMAIGFMIGGLAGWLLPFAAVLTYKLLDPSVGDEAMALGMLGMCTVPVGMGLGVIFGAMYGANK